MVIQVTLSSSQWMLRVLCLCCHFFTENLFITCHFFNLLFRKTYSLALKCRSIIGYNKWYYRLVVNTAMEREAITIRFPTDLLAKARSLKEGRICGEEENSNGSGSSWGSTRFFSRLCGKRSSWSRSPIPYLASKILLNLNNLISSIIYGYK